MLGQKRAAQRTSSDRIDGFKKPNIFVDLWQRRSIKQALNMGEFAALIAKLREHPENLPSAVSVLGKHLLGQKDFTTRDRMRRVFERIIASEENLTFLRT